MSSPRNEQPLLDTTSDSEDVNEDAISVVKRRSFDDFGNESGYGHNSSHSDINDTDTHDIRDLESTDDYDDDTQQLFKAPNTVPVDRFSFTYIVFYLLGMTTLLPWNFFITAEDYWMFKFRNVTSNSSEITPIQATFTSDLTFSASIPSTMFLILNAIYGHKFRLHLRMVGSLVVILIFFACNTVLIKVNTDKWQDTFFDVTIVSVVVMNIATAILSGGLFGISGQFPSEYITAVVSGQALGGVFTAIIEIITITFASDPSESALIFFTIGNILLVLSLVAYILMGRTKFFKYYTTDRSGALSPKNSRLQLQRQPSLVGMEPKFWEVMNKMWLYGFTEWMVFVATLSVYPSVTVLISSQNRGHPWNDVYFIPVTNYLIFNSGDYLGRILAGLIEWPNDKPHLVAVMSILRIAFLPALLFCNTTVRHRLPVFIHSDYIFILLMCFFAFTNGYLANIAMIWAPKSVRNQEKEMASSIMAAFLGIGLAFGSSISLVIVQLL
ncbi:equilibrative nucleoside transporter 1 [Contarinia nasturtii]|uniref:equilibrative nucleoside transporter 1 n=1 Tax=Contarinia nasturtii TaxID=265458 RepID=UPI0012D4C035|nr:equilibrative nucleoside transporter 1 [Contarinia nasturtii]